jgi:acetate CoA/acetoacetate CoA-transferase alpha subunit
MKNKVVSMEQAVSHINDGVRLMVGGFMCIGSPNSIIDAIVARGVKGITLISNDTGRTGFGCSRLIAAKAVKTLLTTHIGLNPETGKQMVAGELDVTLIPQGTMAEQIRSAGYGLGGVLTPTAIGTESAQGKQVINIDGKDFLLEKPIRAEVAILKGSIVDTYGNIYYKMTTRNFNPLMAMAADLVIVEADEIVEVGKLNPDLVMTSGIFVDYVVGGNNNG